jgi:uncharacterized membrane protein
MTKTRLEAFSDGVIAILITIMVLELKVPHGGTMEALRESLPEIGIYLMSFVFLGIYWNNHHHLLHVTERINGKILWANLHLLFWLSLIPFVTAWMGQSDFAPLAVALYGVVMIACAIGYTIMLYAILALHGPESKLARAVGSDTKGKLSLGLYAIAIPLAFVHPAISGALYATVSLIWLIPDRRIELLFYG